MSFDGGGSFGGGSFGGGSFGGDSFGGCSDNGSCNSVRGYNVEDTEGCGGNPLPENYTWDDPPPAYGADAGWQIQYSTTPDTANSTGINVIRRPPKHTRATKAQKIAKLDRDIKGTTKWTIACMVIFFFLGTPLTLFFTIPGLYCLLKAKHYLSHENPKDAKKSYDTCVTVFIIGISVTIGTLVGVTPVALVLGLVLGLQSS